ncbi:MAG: acyl-CoA dehydrogenase family protein, partial [Chloroflexi bacterium]|nr:acyl-CoA dehydrogenase family protein [Chloroflexota bacterium]
MIFELNPEQRAFRDELCAFLSAELSPETYGKYYDENAYGGWSFEYWRILRKKLGERGYIGLNWPKEYGG